MMFTNKEIERCVQECMKCVQACNRCYYTCLNEPDVEKMKECVRLDRECATICFYTADALTRGTPFIRQIAELCAQICEACAAESRRHAHDHCKRCTEACLACAEACRRLVSEAA